MIDILIISTLVCVGVELISYLLRENKTWVVPKGEHYSWLSFLPVVLRKRKNNGSLSVVTFEINDTMLHSLNEVDMYDWNKITGEGFLTWESLKWSWKNKKAPHHYNSWRLAWRYFPETQEVSLGGYFYFKGVRYDKEMMRYKNDGVPTEFRLFIDRLDDEVIFTIRCQSNHISFTETTHADNVLEIEPQHVYGVNANNNLSGWCYRLRPFFGGNTPAPRKIKVKYSFGK